MSKEHTILAKACCFEYEEKRSRFICYLYPVAGKNELSSYIQALKTEFPDASHHCSAYILGSANQPVTQGFDDDGEPSGTAGRPMLNVLTQRGVGGVFGSSREIFWWNKAGCGRAG